MIMDIVKSCPFCGSTAVVVECSGSSWYVRCNNCEATGPSVTDGVEGDTAIASERWSKLSYYRNVLNDIANMPRHTEACDIARNALGEDWIP